MHSGTVVPKRHLQPRQSNGCISCPPTPPCNCSSNESCFQINRDCNTCGTFKCVANSDDSSSTAGGSGGTSKGALAGAVVGVLVALAAAIYLVVWYRRRRALKASAIPEAKIDVPAPAEAVLNRPDPSEKLSSRPPTELTNTRIYSTQSDGTIDLDPQSQRSASVRAQSQRTSTNSNPFSDSHLSIQTTGSTGTGGTNVIPIALVPPGSMSTISSNCASENHPLTPIRPERSGELDLGMDHLNVSRQGTGAAYPRSQISGISGVSSRHSYISNMSYSSEFLNEAPVIVTPTQGGVVRQVIGSVKAEMISASVSSRPSTPNSPNSTGSSLTSRPSIRSPLAASSFGPSDVLREREEEPELPAHSPFDDENSAKNSQLTPSTVTTFNIPSPGSPVTSVRGSELQEPHLPWAQFSESSRPSSMSTQAGSIVADIGSATRINVGLGGLQSGSTFPNTPSTAGQNLRSPYRTTMARLVNPPSTENLGTLEQQQQRALDHAQARAQAQGGEKSRRVSGSSAISNTADSILESFPFVPPSPISDRPIRSPPRSPLNQRVFNATSAPQPSTQSSTQPSTPPPPHPPPPPEPANPPENRRTLGMSTGSQLSTASSGLGSFPFQIESGPAHESHGGAPPSSFPGPGPGRQRASLDTLALTSDLSSYPLGYDRAESKDRYPTS